ncbi:MAG: hypothetical protein A2V93_06640 [Ignavibacteria bacterium RBG_16_34_14]|nr:MAG: hypothetical protein A2V93_06640 [Ignavibacteria bacterium RBG_16_34_14]
MKKIIRSEAFKDKFCLSPDFYRDEFIYLSETKDNFRISFKVHASFGTFLMLRKVQAKIIIQNFLFFCLNTKERRIYLMPAWFIKI